MLPGTLRPAKTNLMTQTSVDEDFAELRSLMHVAMQDERWSFRVWTLINKAHQYHREVYFAQWQPYLSGFSHQWNRPLSVLHRLEQFDEVMDITPFARFGLNLRNKRLEDQDVETLVANPHFVAITDLWLDHNDLGDKAALAIASSPYATSLERLSIAHCSLTDEGLESLFSSPHLSSLSSLDVNNNLISANGLSSATTFDLFGQLEVFDFAWEDIEPEHADILLNAKTLRPALEKTWARLWGEECELRRLRREEQERLQEEQGRVENLYRVLDEEPEVNRAWRSYLADDEQLRPLILELRRHIDVAELRRREVFGALLQRARDLRDEI